MYILVLTALLAKALQSHCPQQLSPPPCLQGWSLALADMLAMTLQNPEDHPSAWSSFKLTSRMGTSSEPIIKGRAFQTAVLCTRCKYFRTINLRCFNKITVEKFLWIFAVSWANTKFLKPCTLKTGFFASLNYPVHALNSKQWITWLHCKKKETNCIRQPESMWETAAQFILQPRHTENPQTICEGIHLLALRAWKFLTTTLKCICNDSSTDVLRVVWFYDKLGSYLSGYLMQPYQSKPLINTISPACSYATRVTTLCKVKTTNLFCRVNVHAQLSRA